MPLVDLRSAFGMTLNLEIWYDRWIVEADFCKTYSS
jgi:hypothetical protein